MVGGYDQLGILFIKMKSRIYTDHEKISDPYQELMDLSITPSVNEY